MVPQSILNHILFPDGSCLPGHDSGLVDSIVHHLALPHGGIPAHSRVGIDGSGLRRVQVVNTPAHIEHPQASGDASLHGATTPAAPAVATISGRVAVLGHRGARR